MEVFGNRVWARKGRGIAACRNQRNHKTRKRIWAHGGVFLIRGKDEKRKCG